MEDYTYRKIAKNKLLHLKQKKFNVSVIQGIVEKGIVAINTITMTMTRADHSKKWNTD